MKLSSIVFANFAKKFALALLIVTVSAIVAGCALLGGLTGIGKSGQTELTYGPLTIKITSTSMEEGQLVVEGTMSASKKVDIRARGASMPKVIVVTPATGAPLDLHFQRGWFWNDKRVGDANVWIQVFEPGTVYQFRALLDAKGNNITSIKTMDFNFRNQTERSDFKMTFKDIPVPLR